jgi:DNA helicase-2/ATP-dependent DNA helicase PcrA
MNAAAMTLPLPTSRDYRTLLRLAYEPSIHQRNIFDWVLDEEGHAVVEAVAGSGKTTTIVSAARLITVPGLFVAFNKVIAEKLGLLLQGTKMSSSTVHSHGMKAISAAFNGTKRRVKVDSSKYRTMVRAARDAAKANGRICGHPLGQAELDIIREPYGFPEGPCLKLLDLARLSLLDMTAADFDEQLMSLSLLHDIDFEPCLKLLICVVVQNCMMKGRDFGESGPIDIDFTDMLWVPHVNGYEPKRYEWLMVDECQDISKAARALLKASIEPGGRTLWVGDRRQAIYGFAGADAQSFQAIIDEMSAKVLPLSVCYRCPVIALDIAREHCPQIEARPGAPLGTLRTIDRANYVSEAKQGDLVLCRRNAPLLGLCFELIAAGVHAVVRGRDIGAGLIQIVEKVCNTVSWSDFRLGLDAWEEAQIDTARKSIKDEDRLADKIDQIGDKATCVRVIWARSRACSRAELVKVIEDLFSDDNGSPVMLSSVHKAKGLEAVRVAILEPERLGVSRGSANCQEGNVRYVAYTRVMEHMLEIPGEARAA